MARKVKRKAHTRKTRKGISRVGLHHVLKKGSKKRKLPKGFVSHEFKKGQKSPSKGGKAHPGFKGAEEQIEKREGISKEGAGAILASAARKASGAAKRINPRLKRVRGA